MPIPDSTNPATLGVNLLLSDASEVSQAFASPGSALSFVRREALSLAGQGTVADTKNLWPAQNLGKAQRLLLAGVPKIENVFHYPLEQGRLREGQIGNAISVIQHKKVDLDEKIQHYLSLNSLALDAQLTHTPRVVKLAKDSVKFIQQVRTYTNEILGLVAAMQANIQVLLACEAQMLNMIRANINALGNLISEICNWGLPDLPSLAAQLGNLWHWNGFNFNIGFNFKPNLAFNVNFSYAQCQLRSPDLAVLFGSPALSLADGDLTLTPGIPPAPLDGDYADTALLAQPTPEFISTMQSTTTPVFDPSKSASTTSLPNPEAIVSNYLLPATTYTENVVSAVPALQPIVIQPGDPDYSTTPSQSRLTTFGAMLNTSVNLGQVVASNYDPNVTAAWLLYLDKNRAGRAGQWISNYQATYASVVAPSVNYLNTTPVPWNTVLGGSGTSDGPTAIPMISALKADTTNNTLWRLSFIEAALLGYQRNRTWDSAADATYTGAYTGMDLDFRATAINATPTATILLGVGTASFPVSCTYPQSIASVLQQVIALATKDIAITPGYQSTRPQFRFTYDMFAQATLVDRFSQFWREFNANLQALLTQDPYLVSFVTSYEEALNSAINPLADQTIYQALQTDAASRNRNWAPGSKLLTIPKASNAVAAYVPPTDQTSGWANGVFDAATFLARPDIQAHSLPVQVAMLRTNQSYAALLSIQTDLQDAVQRTVNNAQLITQTAGIPGWEVETNVPIAVPPGAAGLTLGFDQIDFDQTGYVSDPATIIVQQTSPFILSVSLSWDTAGAIGTRSVVVLQNGTPVTTASSDINSPDPYSIEISTLLSFNQGDVLQVQASHSLDTSQTLLVGSTFLGMLDASATEQDTTPVTGSTPAAGTTNFQAGVAFPVLTAVAQNPDGTVYPIDPTSTTVGVTPFVDGIAMQAATAPGDVVPVAVAYGTIFDAPTANWTIGGLIYVMAGGALTQDYAGLTTNTPWVVCVGKAVTPTSFIFEPHIPTNYITAF